MGTSTIVVVLLVILLLFCVIVAFYAFSLVPFGIYFQCKTSGVPISMFQLAMMNIRKVPVGHIIETYIRARKANIHIELARLEVHYLSNGNIGNVIDAIVSASKSNLSLDFEQAAAIDLAGRDVDQAVRQSVTPKVITTDLISAVAKDGIELKVKVRIIHFIWENFI